MGANPRTSLPYNDGESRSPVLADRLRQFLADSRIEPCRLVIAVSGGADSTAMLLAFAELRARGFEPVCGHVNHHLRGAESDEDEWFVRELCAGLDIPLSVGDGTLDAALTSARGVEAAARAVRYERLREIREHHAAHYVATAHSMNDQAETVLIRLLTGGGVAALRGIHPVREDGVIRPLLGVSRVEVEDYVRRHAIVPRHDRSNDDPRFLRNRVRSLLRDLGGVEQLASVADQARAFWPLVERAIEEQERTCVEAPDSEARFISLPDDEWLRGAILQRQIRRLDPEARDFDARRIARDMPSLKRASVTRNLELVRKGDALVLRRPPAAAEPFEVELTASDSAYIDTIQVTVRLARHPEGPTPAAPRQQFQLPAGAQPAFTVRSRRPGDRFQPLGMTAPKKLKGFVIDRKIAAEVRDRLPLLIWNGEIVWIAGVEVSERFKITTAEGDLYDVWLEGPGAADERDHAGFRD